MLFVIAHHIYVSSGSSKANQSNTSIDIPGLLAASASLIAISVFSNVYPDLFPRALSDDDLKGGRDYVIKLVEWERDRVLTIAKGIAGTSVTYFAALIPLIFKNELSVTVPGWHRGRASRSPPGAGLAAASFRCAARCSDPVEKLRGMPRRSVALSQRSHACPRR